MNKNGFEKKCDTKTQKRLRVQSRANGIALTLSVLMLVAIFIFSKSSVSKLERELNPLIDEAMIAAHADAFDTVGSIGRRLDDILHTYEPVLMICASHRDIIDLLRCSGEIAALGANGERDDYIESLAAIKVMLHLLKENNSVSLGNIL